MTSFSGLDAYSRTWRKRGHCSLAIRLSSMPFGMDNDDVSTTPRPMQTSLERVSLHVHSSVHVRCDNEPTVHRPIASSELYSFVSIAPSGRTRRAINAWPCATNDINISVLISFDDDNNRPSLCPCCLFRLHTHKGLSQFITYHSVVIIRPTHVLIRDK